MFLFVGLEIRSIYLDQAEHDEQQAIARGQQLENFRKIGDGINTAITGSQRQFTGTMEGFENTLGAVKQTINNTRPKAILSFAKLVGGEVSPLVTSSKIPFNVYVTNSGTDTATHVVMEAKVYVGKLDDANFQRNMLVAFNRSWQRDSHKPSALLLTPIPVGSTVFFSITSDPLTTEEVEALEHQTQTIYVMLRLLWVDQTGRWTTDNCQAYQDKLFTTPVTHTCKFIPADRVRYKERNY